MKIAMPSHFIFRMILLVTVAGLTFGCRKADDAALFYNKAKACYEAKDYVCARTALEKAVAINPEFAGAYANLGEVYLKLGMAPESLDSYVRAVKLAPEQPEIQMKLATLYLLNRDTERARGILREVLSRHPENLSAKYLMAEFFQMEKNPDAAADLFRSIIRDDPSQVRAYLNLSAILIRQCKLREAENILAEAHQKNPSALHPVIALHNLYLHQKKYDTAEKFLKNAILMHPERTELHLLLANLYCAMAKPDQSASEFQKAIALNPDNPEVYLMAANFYNSINQPDQALAMYEKALSLQPENPGLLMHVARFHLSRRNIAATERYTRQLLAAKPDFLPAKILKGELLMAKSQWDEALSYFSDLIEKNPELPRLYYLKGLSLLKRKEPHLAKIEFGKIPPGCPEYIQARLLLAGIFVGENSFAQAKKSIEDILHQDPDHYEANKLLCNIHLQDNQFDQAETCLNRLIELSPQNPDGYFLMGLLHKRRENHTAAIASFEAALAKGHADINVLVNLISALLKSGMMEEAIARCDAAILNLKSQPRAQAVVYDLKGKIHLAQNLPLPAEKAFKSALIADPNYLPPYYSLAKLYFSEGREESAIRQYQAALHLQSGSQKEMPNMMLGILFSMKNQPEPAELHYRKALEIKPDFAPAANNLAYLLAEQDRNLDEALRLAQTAKKHLPDDPRVMDTLGWVYLKLGFYDHAIAAFTESIQNLPENATLHYHLGMAYYKKGDAVKARSALEQAFKLNEDFSGADQARKILAEISA